MLTMRVQGTLFGLTFYFWLIDFYHTSPYAAIAPPLGSFWRHPIQFVRDGWQAFVFVQAAQSDEVEVLRAAKVRDTQYQRIYRRAHGLEDTSKPVMGVDVAGLVPWDDGLSEAERAVGKRLTESKGREVMKLGKTVDEDEDEFLRRYRRDQAVRVRKMEDEKKMLEEEEAKERARKKEDERRGKRKLWLGLW